MVMDITHYDPCLSSPPLQFLCNEFSLFRVQNQIKLEKSFIGKTDNPLRTNGMSEDLKFEGLKVLHY